MLVLHLLWYKVLLVPQGRKEKRSSHIQGDRPSKTLYLATGGGSFAASKTLCQLSPISAKCDIRSCSDRARPYVDSRRFGQKLA